MKVIIEFDTRSAAFDGNFSKELEKLLEQASNKILQQVLLRKLQQPSSKETSDKLLDTNGILVGWVRTYASGE